MRRIIPLAVVATLITVSGCRRDDSVVATYVWPKATETRMVFFRSSRYEVWLLKDGMPKHPFRKPLIKYPLHNSGLEANTVHEPIETGTYIRSSTNLVLTVEPDARHSSGWATNRVYRIVQLDGTQCLLDERFGPASMYEQSNHTKFLRLVWKREK